ncbi:MAG: hypothetical protein QF384_13780 [Alphaproteobacteria bacterium]|jgi:hypothetical protein|nr:hypothetical protein [Alphaproteobacteria bacterium]MDP6875333.1 hypothetical protein [Alphaproteobacteria bacterium]
MELNLSPSSTQVADKFRPVDVDAPRPVEKTDESGGEEASLEAESLKVAVAAKDGDEEQPRKSAVDSDTGRNIDLSV